MLNKLLAGAMGGGVMEQLTAALTMLDKKVNQFEATLARIETRQAEMDTALYDAGAYDVKEPKP